MIKTQVFGDAQHGFGLPRSLAWSSVAVRILHTHYDHASPLWLQCHSLPELWGSESKELTQLATDDVEESQEEAKKAREEPSMPAEQGMSSEGRKSMLSFKENSNSTAEIKEPEEEAEKKSETLDVPLEVQDPPLPEEMKEEAVVRAEESIVDLQHFVPLGGVYHIDALQLPPQVRHVRGWTMVQVLKGGLEAFPYPSGEAEEASQPPTQITLRLPDQVVYFVPPVVAGWDPAGQQWRTDGISSVVYEKQEKRITFQLGTFSAVALLQDAHLNMPYQAWELQPTGVDEALLAVTTAFATIQIQIKDNQCMLSSITAEEEDLLSPITGKWLSPVGLRAVLTKAGVNIFPGEFSHSYACVRKASEHLQPDSAQAWSLYLFNGQHRS